MLKYSLIDQLNRHERSKGCISYLRSRWKLRVRLSRHFLSIFSVSFSSYLPEKLLLFSFFIVEPSRKWKRDRANGGELYVLSLQADKKRGMWGAEVKKKITENCWHIWCESTWQAFSYRSRESRVLCFARRESTLVVVCDVVFFLLFFVVFVDYTRTTSTNSSA